MIRHQVHHAHVFTPLPPTPGESSWRRLWTNVQSYWDFSQLRVARERRLKELGQALRPLVNQIGRRQAAGEGMQYSDVLNTNLNAITNRHPLWPPPLGGCVRPIFNPKGYSVVTPSNSASLAAASSLDARTIPSLWCAGE